MKLVVGRALGLLACLCCVLSIGAEVPRRAEVSYSRSSWRVSDGLPEDTVQAVTEAGGLLWVGTTGGLARFDGSRIQGLGQALSHSIFCLAVGQDGSLWAGSEGAGLLRVRGGKLDVFSNAQGLTDDFVRSVLVDDRRRVWAGTDDGLFVLDGGRMRRVDASAEFAPMAVHSIMEDREHRIWAGGSRLIALDAKGHVQEFALPGAYSKNRVKRILQTSDGTVWVGTVEGLERLRGGRFTTFAGIHATVRSLLETEDGTLWIGTIGDGLWTLREDHLTHLNSSGLLPSDTVLSIYEDDQRQIWIGTQAGLVRLNKTPVRVIPLPEGGDSDFATISGDPSGSIWMAGRKLYVIRDGAARRVSYAGLESAAVRNVYRQRDGTLWLGTDGSGAYRIREKEVTHYTAPAELTNNFIRGFLESRSGDMWVATDEGVSRLLSGGVSQKFTEANGLAFFSTRSLIEDSVGSIWIGTDRGLSRWKDGQFQEDAATRGLAGEKVWSILEDRVGTLWFGTRDRGLFRYRGGILRQFTVEQGLPSNSIYQMLEDRKHTFWLSGPNTIASIPEAEMEQEFGLADRPLSVHLYSMPFGADGADMYGGRQPAGYLAPDDSVWFPTTRGAANIAYPEQPPRPVPRASLGEVVEDGREVASVANLQVPSRVARLSFLFGAISLRSQKEVRFRYKLENFDKGWNAAGADRMATYTNLPAGRYRFRVQCFDTSQPDGGTEAELSFRKQPFFYQTWWFYSLFLLGLVSLAWMIYKVRFRSIRASYSAVLAERSRMARDLHDTVIQGCTGISALLEAMASTPGQVAMADNELLEYARTQARTTIDEAREAVWKMRHESDTETDLVASLEGMISQVAREFGTVVDFQHDTNRLAVGSSVAHEILMTVREAVSNAVQHSGVSTVELQMQVLADDLAITIADEGCGFPANSPDSVRDGHYGILGMRERMARLGGRFEVMSDVGRGTRVRLLLRRAAMRDLAKRG